jgi:hypothetical protein
MVDGVAGDILNHKNLDPKAIEFCNDSFVRPGIMDVIRKVI